MTASDAAALARKLVEGMNAGDLEAVGALASEDVEFVDVAAGEHVSGREAWREYCGRYLTGFPGMRIEEQNVVALGDSAVLEAVARGTHTGPLEGPGGAIPATGKTIEVPFCFVIRVRDGEMVDSREYYDAMTLMMQLGLVPAPDVASGT